MTDIEIDIGKLCFNCGHPPHDHCDHGDCHFITTPRNPNIMPKRCGCPRFVSNDEWDELQRELDFWETVGDHDV